MKYFLLLLLLPQILFCSIEEVPCLHEGRVRPLGTVQKSPQIEKTKPFVIKPTLQSSLLLQLQNIKGPKILPGKDSLFFSVNALAALSKEDIFLKNFTLYEETHFLKIREAYLHNPDKLPPLLLEGYAPLPTHYPHLPSKAQLKIELILTKIPLFALFALLYFLSFLALIFTSFGNSLLYTTLFFHTSFLALRCYILQRPPVANMMETALWVSFIATLTSCLFNNKAQKVAAAFASTALFSILWILNYSMLFETIPPVLDSNFWLFIHVLLVVGSYGLFILAGLLGHLTLIQYARKKPLPTAKPTLHTIYIGLGMLIAGTLLGGAWAAQSWGRFWDWDPKEAWAFILSCVYLLLVHQYSFRKIGTIGLAYGAILGLLTTTFTWYGVNYLLGTGLHSYGFGAGGEWVYFAYIALEMLFLAAVFFYTHSKNFALKIRR